MIRYSSGTPTAATDANAGYGVLLSALDNFQYTALTADLNLTDSGTLVVLAHIGGANPSFNIRFQVRV